MGKYIRSLNLENTDILIPENVQKEIDYRLNDEDAPMDYLLWTLANMYLIKGNNDENR